MKYNLFRISNINIGTIFKGDIYLLSLHCLVFYYNGNHTALLLLKTVFSIPPVHLATNFWQLPLLFIHLETTAGFPGKDVGFDPTIFRHGIARTSSALLIWLNQMVPKSKEK